MRITISEHSHTIQSGGEQLTLEQHIQKAKAYYNIRQVEHLETYGFPSEIPFEDEDLPWAIQEWYGAIGEFSQEELDYLKEKWDLEDYDIEFLLTDPNEEE
ncbi:MAG: hypothetical protein K2O54_00760 [Prevotella sp.]|nr:hypothetical protein [Prevotella sp.]